MKPLTPLVFATDYDGTLALNGRVGATTMAALERLKRAGFRLILISGRQLDDLATVFDGQEIFDRLILENGALLHVPKSKQSKRLGTPPPPAFAEALRKAGVSRLNCGEVIVATWRPYETIVFETIARMRLDLQVIFNKDAVMILPPGINKASGLRAALDDLGASPSATVGVGDAENDLDFLRLCGFSAAVANALPEVKQAVDYTAQRDHGAGVEELVEHILSGQAGRRFVPAGARERPKTQE
ncbi:MAG TPA: HAD family hydrolase [Candidatus Binataceae bacterium]|jgi:hydroxymethylpyrimidine pyrophosphatase-like HAD family hydrolase|nr:HAD family hydrolase [Candidatus Binataceae bacterium]